MLHDAIKAVCSAELTAVQIFMKLIRHSPFKSKKLVYEPDKISLLLANYG
jgi:hypothetical protein